MKKAFSIVLIAVVCIIGIFALRNYKNANDTKENSEVDIYKTSEYQEIIKGSYLTYEEKFDKNGNAYLYDDENKKKVKPSIEASVIYYDDISSKEDFARFISKESGKIGFINSNGEVVIQPEYVTATKMYEGYSVVSNDKQEGYYYINEKGEKLNDQIYEEGENFTNGIARVKYKDSRAWGLLSAWKGPLVDGFDKINDFDPVTEQHITGIINGKAAMMILDGDNVKETKVLGYKDISQAYHDCFAIVENDEGKYGVIDVSSPDDPLEVKEVIPTSYDNITYNVIDDNPWYGAHARFICTLSDRNDVIVEEF